MTSGSEDDERFDGLYINVAHTTRGIEPLLDTVFSFLRRKTDFYAGPPGSGEQGTQMAIDKVNEVVKKHADLYLQSQQTKKKQKTKAPTKKPAPASAKKSTKDEESVIEMGNDGGFDVSSTAAPESKKIIDETESPVELKEAEQVLPTKDENEKANDSTAEEGGDSKGPPPPGNGGTVEGKYVWTQTLSELSLTVPVPDNTRGRDLDVTIAKKHLKIGLRSGSQESWIVDAPLTKAIIVDDSFWTVEDGNRLMINLQKLNQMEWWDCVCDGDPKIDVRAIQPENSSLADLDGDMRKTVEKMMYDQRQKAMGLPTSDEEEKLNMLEKFKLQHPELDFSNAKIS